MERLIRISGGEPEYKTPEHIIDAMKKAMDEGHTHYGDFHHIPELREAIAARYQKLGVDVNPDHVLITPGSSMGIYMVLRGLAQPGEKFVTTNPCFFGYLNTMRHVGVRWVDLPRYKGEGWSIHTGDLEKAITPKTRGILLCSPDNPTGSTLKKDELEGIAEIAKEKDIYVISDDIYDSIIYDGNRFQSIAALPGMQERTIILNGFSKTYAMTGWRLGYLIAPNEELYERFFEIQMSTYLVVNAAVQRAGLAALTGPQDCVRDMVDEYDEKRRYVLDAYDEIDGVTVTKPEGAFYVFPDASSYGLSSMKLTEYLRNEYKVVVTPGSIFGSIGEGHFRQAYAQSMEDIEEGLSRIKKALNNL